MNEQKQQFLNLYQECRYEDQKGFYEKRMAEFQRARSEVITIQTILMAIAAITAFFAASGIGWKIFWTLLAVILPILSTALISYDGLYDFERHAKLYRDARNALYRVSAKDPGLPSNLSEEARSAQVIDYVKSVEAIFHKEQGQWGQLTSEAKPSAPSDISQEK